MENIRNSEMLVSLKVMSEYTNLKDFDPLFIGIVTEITVALFLIG